MNRGLYGDRISTGGSVVRGISVLGQKVSCYSRVFGVIINDDDGDKIRYSAIQVYMLFVTVLFIYFLNLLSLSHIYNILYVFEERPIIPQPQRRRCHRAGTGQATLDWQQAELYALNGATQQ